MIELGDRRETRAFGQDQPHDVLAARAEDFAHEGVEHALDQHARRNVDLAHLLERAEHWMDQRAHEVLEQRFLVGEVEIDRALRDARALRHVVEPRAFVTARGKLLERRIEDRAAPRFGRGGAALARQGRGVTGRLAPDARARGVLRGICPDYLPAHRAGHFRLAPMTDQSVIYTPRQGNNGFDTKKRPRLPAGPPSTSPPDCSSGYCFGAVVAGGVIGAGAAGGALRSIAGCLPAVCWWVGGAKPITPPIMTTIGSKESGTPQP